MYISIRTNFICKICPKGCAEIYIKKSRITEKPLNENKCFTFW